MLLGLAMDLFSVLRHRDLERAPLLLGLFIACLCSARKQVEIWRISPAKYWASSCVFYFVVYSSRIESTADAILCMSQIGSCQCPFFNYKLDEPIRTVGQR